MGKGNNVGKYNIREGKYFLEVIISREFHEKK